MASIMQGTTPSLYGFAPNIDYTYRIVYSE